MTKKILILLPVFILVLFNSCSKDDDNGPAVTTITVDTIGLEPLNGGTSYQGWLIVDGKPKPTAKFTDPSGLVKLEVLVSDIEKTSQFVLTIEPKGDNDDIPSNAKILVGDFKGTAAQLSFSSVVTDLTNISGRFFLATPTDNVNDVNNGNDEYGVWFMNSDNTAGLSLPVLGNGWKYEGWVDFDGKVLSTGTFSKVNTVDDGNFFKGSGGTVPAFPGEDFLVIPSQIPLTGITLPAKVTGKKVFITIEPFQDNDPAPFFIKPLSKTAGITTGAENPVIMDVSTEVPSGRVTRPN